MKKWKLQEFDIKWDIKCKDAFVGFNVKNDRCAVAMEIYKVEIVRSNTDVKSCNVVIGIYKVALLR